MTKRKFLFFIPVFFFSLNFAFAATIKGLVFDNTGEPATGATVILLNSKYNTAAGLDGSYSLANIPVGTYKIKVDLLPFSSLEQEITITKDDEIINLNFTLQPSSVNGLKEVIVSSGRASGNSDAGARTIEKNSMNIMNILSGRTLQLMPDVTVANVLRRVSGVTVDRGENGEGRYPVIRGMDKRYNYTLINGIKIPSPDDKNRYVPMDIFPSEILQRLEVIKDLTPEMEGDAVGGVMNLVMKDAPSQLMVQAQGALGYSQMLFNNTYRSYNHDLPMRSPAEIHGSNYATTFSDFSRNSFSYKTSKPLPDGQLGLTIGNRFLKNKLGVIISGMYQSTSRNSDALFFEPNPQPQPAYMSQIPELSSLQLRNYSIHTDRLALHAKVDYDFNENNKISLYAVGMKLNTYQMRYMVDSTTGNRTLTSDGWGTGQVGIDYRSKTTLQSIYNATLQGDHKITPQLSLNWKGVFSEAQQKTPDWTDLATTHTLSKNASGTITGPAPYLSTLSYIWQHNMDKDLSGYLNLHYKFNVGDQKFDIGAGGMYRHKNRNNYYIQYGLEAPPGSQIPFTDATSVQFEYLPADNPLGQYSGEDPNNYIFTENIAAVYAQIRWQPDKRWDVLVGARNEHTSDSYVQTLVDPTTAGQNGKITYSDILPSASVKYKITDNSALHLSYFSSISRPSFYEMIPAVRVEDFFDERGNPYLKHSTANNVDLRYELFPGSADQLLVGVFYKRIQNPIEQVYMRDPAVPSTTYLEPQNLGTANNAGVELVYTKYFNKFGVSFNYTYTYSNVSSSKKFYYDTTGASSLVKYINQNRPLAGQAANIGNIALLYKDTKNGMDAQISAVYTGRHIVYVSPYYDMDYWALGTIVLDFSAEKKITKHFSVYAKVGNLLNTADAVKMLKQPVGTLDQIWPVLQGQGSVLVEKRHYGQTYLVGLRYNL